LPEESNESGEGREGGYGQNWVGKMLKGIGTKKIEKKRRKGWGTPLFWWPTSLGAVPNKSRKSKKKRVRDGGGAKNLKKRRGKENKGNVSDQIRSKNYGKGKGPATLRLHPKFIEK